MHPRKTALPRDGVIITKSKRPNNVLKISIFLFGILLAGCFGTLLTIVDGCTDSIATPSRNNIILVKIGGSSVTHKEQYESLNRDSLDWFSRTIASALSDYFRPPTRTGEDCTLIDNDGEDDGKLDSCSISTSSVKNDTGLAFVIVHGAGSFGHFSAKEYGLKGQFLVPSPSTNRTSSSKLSMDETRYKKQGLAKTRLSVQKLNHLVVESLVEYGVNAVSISPCFGIPGIEAHSGIVHYDDPTSTSPLATLSAMVHKTIQAGLVPVLHGDACLYGNHDAGILSGDTLMEVLGTNSWINEVVFITDVDGVYENDPRQNPHARLLRQIYVDPTNGEIVTELTASGSSHEHDVTGGLQVRCRMIPLSR